MALTHQKQLTSKQMKLYRFIEDYINQAGRSPSFREMQAGMGVKSVSSIQEYLKRLEAAGYISRASNQFRNIKLLKPSGVPILGAIAAGSLMEAFCDGEVARIPLSVFRGLGWATDAIEGCFALRVQGDSMKDAMITDGDVVVMRRPENAADIKNGTIVAARVGSQTTLKRLQRTKRAVRLQPANRAYKAIEVDPLELEIQGVYVGVLRGMVAA